MVFALATCLILESYEAAEIAVDLRTPYYPEVHIRDDGLVAGYAINHVPPGHGEGAFGVPFVWEKGKLYLLPTSDYKFGHVRAVGPEFVVGDVRGSVDWLPAKWTPDKTEGWAKAKLELLTKEEGIGRQVDPDGTVWIDSENSVSRLRNGKVEVFPAPRFEFEGVDRKGRIFGTSYEAIEYGGVFRKPRAAYLQDGKTMYLTEDKDSTIRAFSRTGTILISLGNASDGYVLWTDETLKPVPELEGTEWSQVRGLGEDGSLFGTLKRGQHYFPAIVRDSKVIDLTNAISSTEVEKVLFSDRMGRMLVTTGKGVEEQLYLLTPRK